MNHETFNARKSLIVFEDPLNQMNKDDWDNTGFGVFYILECNNEVKIGSSCQPFTRYKTLVSTLFKYGEIVAGRFAISVLHVNFRENEKKIHDFLSDYRVRFSEMFQISFDETLEALHNLNLEFDYQNDDTTNQFVEATYSGLKTAFEQGRDNLRLYQETYEKFLNLTGSLQKQMPQFVKLYDTITKILEESIMITESLELHENVLTIPLGQTDLQCEKYNDWMNEIISIVENSSENKPELIDLLKSEIEWRKNLPFMLDGILLNSGIHVAFVSKNYNEALQECGIEFDSSDTEPSILMDAIRQKTN